MKKAFVLTTDGIFAIAVITLMLGVFIAYYQISDEFSRAASAVDDNVSDTAIVAFYLGKDASDFGIETSIGEDLKYGSCSHTYTIEFNNDASQTLPSDNNFCIGGG